MEILKNMVCAVLSFETERKRLLICDEPENILLWIAAVEYTLPLPAALDLNFTTYASTPPFPPRRSAGWFLRYAVWPGKRPPALCV